MRNNKRVQQVVTHQPAISFSISFQHPFNRAGRRTSNVKRKTTDMKKTLITIGLCLAMAPLVSATSPIPSHPPAPSITATKAIEVATKFAAVETKAERYCSSVTLVEGGMTPAPHGSARHWIVIFQDAGNNREELRRIYVNMEGIASDVVPPMSK